MTKKIGVIGGMGPLSTALFMKLVVCNTKATKDQQNIPLVIINDTLIPDRTDYILNNSNKNPVLYIKKDISDLEKLKCTDLVILCNTAHNFYDDLTNYTNMNIINMIDIVLRKCKDKGFKKIGLIATLGTINSGVYQKYNKYNLEIINPSLELQEKIHSWIYFVKQNKNIPKIEFMNMLNYFYELGCDGIISGCTEISVVLDDLQMLKKENIIDCTNEISCEVIRRYKSSK